jgi:hypothetical protein
VTSPASPRPAPAEQPRAEVVEAAVRRYRRAQERDGWPVPLEEVARRMGFEATTREALGE